MAGWDTVEGGGLLDNATVTIEKAYFATDAGYLDGEVLLFILEGTSPESDLDENAVRELYSIGNGWDTDDGQVVSHPTLDGFRSSTNYAAFFLAALETEAEKVLQKRGTPDDASIWEGLTFYMERQTIERGGRVADSEVLVPVKFVGEGSDEAPKKKATKKTAKKAGAGGNKALRAKVKKLAKDYDEHDDFVEAVLDTYPEVEEDEDLYEEVLEEDNWDFEG